MNEFEEQAALWDRWATSYDSDSIGFDATATADALLRLAAGGPAVELGVGTGRIALPLAEHGIRVLGLDASPEMAKRLLDRRGDLPVDVRIADMGAFDTEGERYPLIYTVASTLFLLLSQERQISCLTACARALAPTGRLVVETSVPGTAAMPLHQRQQTIVREIGDGHLKLSAILHDPLAQTLRSQEIRLDADGRHQLLPITRRYTYLPELDLMARVAGLRLSARYGDWHLTPYAPGQARHVSVYVLGSVPD